MVVLVVNYVAGVGAETLDDAHMVDPVMPEVAWMPIGGNNNQARYVCTYYDWC